MIRNLFASLAILTALAVTGSSVAAQSGNPFAPAVIVNGRTITNFEIEQRVRIMELFRTPGDVRKKALEALIEDRLRLSAAAEKGIEVDPEAVKAGMEEFAARANMDAEAFVAQLAQSGVSAETFRDFVEAGVAWREVVQTEFDGPGLQITEQEAQRAISQQATRGSAEVVVAEIILPARDPNEAAEAEAIARELQRTISTTGAFAAAARQYSASPTAENGGRLPRALPLEELPGPIRSQMLTLAPGKLTDPITAPNAVAIFQLVELRDLGVKTVEAVEIEYARYFIAGGNSEAARTEAGQVIARVDSCTDLYGVNKGKDPARLQIETVPASQLPSDVGVALARLDEGEFASLVTREGNLMLLMLCSRTPILTEEPDLRVVEAGLLNRKLGSLGDAYLAELRANAIIRYP